MFNWFKKWRLRPTEDTTMKYLIAGLGNIGADYAGTRHNIGFDVVNYLASKFSVSFESKRYGDVATFKHKGRTFILLKPSTYMNLSGQAIRYWMQKEKITQDNLLVVLDDLNIDFGRVRVKSKGGAGGHNGLKNIEALLNSAAYPRVRVGIGNSYNKGQQVDFVLGKWTIEEDDLLQKVIKHSAESILSFGTVGLAHTMNNYNKTIQP